MFKFLLVSVVLKGLSLMGEALFACYGGWVLWGLWLGLEIIHVCHAAHEGVKFWRWLKSLRG